MPTLSKRVTQAVGMTYFLWRMQRSAFDAATEAAARDMIQMLSQDLYQIDKAGALFHKNYTSPLNAQITAFCAAWRATSPTDRPALLPNGPVHDYVAQWEDSLVPTQTQS